jgi:uncharacterized protein YbjT (DUF2867 family)
MYVIAGVTGNTGSVVADALLAKGKKVRVIVRDAKKGDAWKQKGAEVAIVPTFDDAKSLSAALTGAQAAYLLSPPDLASNAFLAERKKTVDAIADAIDAAGVPHVVFLSSIGAQHETGTGIIQSVAYAERRLAKTKAKLTFVRAAAFLENFAAVLPAAKNGVFPSFLPADLVQAAVATQDIGATAANALLEGPPSAKIDVIELAGPRDVSANDLAKILAGIVGKPVTVQVGPTSAVVPTYTGYGISADVAALFQGMYEGMIAGKVAFEGKGARLVRGSTDADTLFRKLLG